MQNSVIRNSCWTSNDVSTIFFNWWKDIYSGHTEKKLKESQLFATAATKKEDVRHDKTFAHTINVQTVTDGISRRVTSGRENTSVILVDHGVKVIEGLLS